MNLKNLIEEYLNQARLMQVATVRDNQPWACSVYFAVDPAMNIYWISSPDRRHSLEIVTNPKVAGTIVLPHMPGDKVRGIQFQGVAKELKEPAEVGDAMSFYAKRFNMSSERVKAIVSGIDGHSCYQVIPHLYVLFDEVNFPKAPRQEYKLILK